MPLRKCSRNWGHKQYKQHGAAVVELAIVLPIFVLIVFGTIEACSMLYLTQSLHIAAYEAARVSLIPQSTTTQVHEAAEQILENRKVQSATIQISPTNYASLSIGSPIRVTVSAPSDANSPIVGMFFTGKTISGVCTMMKEY
jgi:Flp pilus assembly protein TadG